MMEILGQAVEKTKSLDQKKIMEYIHATKFSTVVGDVQFANNGEWTVGRPLYVQYRGVVGNDIDQFRKAGKTPVIFPRDWKSGDLRYPYEEARGK